MRVRLADPASSLPRPDMPGVFVSSEPFTIDIANPYWAQALADGSLIVAPEIPETAPSKKPGTAAR